LAGGRAHEIGGVRQVGRVGQAHQHHLGRLARMRRGLGFAEPLQQHLPGPRQHRHREPLGQRLAAHALGLGHGRVGGGRRGELHARDPVGELEQVLQHQRGIGSRRVEGGEGGQRGGRVPAHRRLEQVEGLGAVGEPEHRAHLLFGDPPFGQRDRLVEQRQPVSHRAVRRAGDERDGGRLDLGAFLAGDPGEVVGQDLGLDAPQIEALAAREHRHRHLANLGGREDELHMLRRLLERLQQRVEGVA
jgi:hypothetical protein